jgi:predicted ABC-type ATPase
MNSFKKFVEGVIEEGPNDPAIFKAIFLAGGPGSGKSFMVKHTGLKVLGFKVVNSDVPFERAMEAAGLEMDPDNIFSAAGQAARDMAKTITNAQMSGYITGRLGLVIDGTGKNFDKIKKQAEKLKAIGYDVSMIFINTDLDTALVRNDERERSLPSQEVISMWKDVQKNIGKFQGYFSQNFIVLDNSEGSNVKTVSDNGYKWATKFAKQPIQNSLARKWINSVKASSK